MLLSLVAALTFTKPVSALCSYAGDLYVGTSSGIVVELDEQTLKEQATFGSADAPVRFISASPYGLAWLCGGGGSIREKAAPEKAADMHLYVRGVGRSVAQVSVHTRAPVRRFAWLNGRVAICYDFGADFFDVAGRPVSAKEFFPASATGMSDSSLFVRELSDRTELAVFAKPISVRLDPQNQSAPLVSLLSAFQVGGAQWIAQGGVATTAFDAFPEGEIVADESGKLSSNAKFLVLSDRVALAEDGIVAREADSLLSAPVMKQGWESSRVGSPAYVGDALWFGADELFSWSWNGAALLRQSRTTGEVVSYFPWLDAEAPTAFSSGANGLWIGRKTGLSFLSSNETERNGGMIVVQLDQEANHLPEDVKKKLSDALFAWRFADTDRAGEDGAKMVASVFSAAGISLPQTADELKSVGAAVTADLHYGDILVGQGKCAVYIGNGATVELRAGKIGNGSVWNWSKPAVRRVL